MSDEPKRHKWIKDNPDPAPSGTSAGYLSQLLSIAPVGELSACLALIDSSAIKCGIRNAKDNGETKEVLL